MSECRGRGGGGGGSSSSEDAEDEGGGGGGPAGSDCLSPSPSPAPATASSAGRLRHGLRGASLMACRRPELLCGAVALGCALLLALKFTCRAGWQRPPPGKSGLTLPRTADTFRSLRPRPPTFPSSRPARGHNGEVSGYSLVPHRPTFVPGEAGKESESAVAFRAKDVIIPAKPPVSFFSPRSPVLDLFQGQLDYAEHVRRDSEVVLLFFYAPWCGQSIAARAEIEQAASRLSDQFVEGPMSAVYIEKFVRRVMKPLLYIPSQSELLDFLSNYEPTKSYVQR
ncbi:hypothetical protein P7K49_023026 [Saguinus oedipus]|uniref:TXNDC11 thioredoxin-like domain-containing protein n=1 Tax=Saguinus oedipus TaxID=9490 RepID=A0ABQ9ULA7_SAGOE|nr:hypothetical protein P7K49_023026 [Saguinus oedipus]